MTTDRYQWMRDTYERIIREAGDDPLALKEVKDRCLRAYVQAEIPEPRRTKVERAEDLFNLTIPPLREKRRQDLSDSLDLFVDALNDTSLFGADDPTLRLAYPLGLSKGQDKILGIWTAEDWNQWSVTRLSNAAKAVAAAERDRESVQTIVSQMTKRRVTTFGDLYLSES